MSFVALSLANLSEMFVADGDLARARSLSTEALGHAEAIEDRRHVSFASTNLGWIELAEERAQESIPWFLQALQFNKELGMSQASVTVLHGIAGALAARGDAAHGAWVEAAAQRYERELDDRLGHIPSLADKGSIPDFSRKRADSSTRRDGIERGPMAKPRASTRRSRRADDRVKAPRPSSSPGNGCPRNGSS